MQKITTLFGLYKLQLLCQTACGGSTVAECSATNSKIEGLSLAAACTEREKTAKKFYET
jgi:hypothetical protein